MTYTAALGTPASESALLSRPAGLPDERPPLDDLLGAGRLTHDHAARPVHALAPDDGAILQGRIEKVNDRLFEGEEPIALVVVTLAE